MGPSQICGCPFREPRVFEIAHFTIFHHISPYFTIFHHISPYFTIFHHISPYFTIFSIVFSWDIHGKQWFLTTFLWKKSARIYGPERSWLIFFPWRFGSLWFSTAPQFTEYDHDRSATARPSNLGCKDLSLCIRSWPLCQHRRLGIIATSPRFFWRKPLGIQV